MTAPSLCAGAGRARRGSPRGLAAIAALALIAPLIGAAGCEKSNSFVLVEVVDATHMLTGVYDLNTRVTVAGTSKDIPVHAEAMIAFPTSFAIEIDRALSGPFSIRVQALKDLLVVAEGESAIAALDVGARNNVTVRIGDERPGDGGTDTTPVDGGGGLGGTSGSGGMTGAGGTGAGGASGLGGASGAGGGSGVGGASGLGGAGGASGAGGGSGSGGATGAGGSGSGGVTGSGGGSGAGGLTSTGGMSGAGGMTAPGTGGAEGTGGVASAGGATGSGGEPGTGGTSGAGGDTVDAGDDAPAAD